MNIFVKICDEAAKRSHEWGQSHGGLNGGHAFLDGNVKSHRAGCRRRGIEEIPETHAGLLSRLVTQQCRTAGQEKAVGFRGRAACQVTRGNIEMHERRREMTFMTYQGFPVSLTTKLRCLIFREHASLEQRNTYSASFSQVLRAELKTVLLILLTQKGRKYLYICAYSLKSKKNNAMII